MRYWARLSSGCNGVLPEVDRLVKTGYVFAVDVDPKNFNSIPHLQPPARPWNK